MTPEQWDRVAHLVVELSRTPNADDDLCQVSLAAAYMLPVNVRLREQLDERQYQRARAKSGTAA